MNVLGEQSYETMLWKKGKARACGAGGGGAGDPGADPAAGLLALRPGRGPHRCRNLADTRVGERRV